MVVEFRTYEHRSDTKKIAALVDKDLSEPYSIFTYRYFIEGWPQHCHMVGRRGSTSCLCRLLKGTSSLVPSYASSNITASTLEVTSQCWQSKRKRGGRGLVTTRPVLVAHVDRLEPRQARHRVSEAGELRGGRLGDGGLQHQRDAAVRELWVYSR
jgi:hypothetical protein